MLLLFQMSEKCSGTEFQVILMKRVHERSLNYRSPLDMAAAIYFCSSVTVLLFFFNWPILVCSSLSPVGQESASWHCSCGTLGVGLKRPAVSAAFLLMDSPVSGCLVTCVESVYKQRSSRALISCLRPILGNYTQTSKFDYTALPCIYTSNGYFHFE